MLVQTENNFTFRQSLLHSCVHYRPAAAKTHTVVHRQLNKMNTWHRIHDTAGSTGTVYQTSISEVVL